MNTDGRSRNFHRLAPRILHQYGWVCQLCGERISRKITAEEDPDGLTFDHIIPRAHGGSNRADNLWPAHRRCNEARGDRLL